MTRLVLLSVVALALNIARAVTDGWTLVSTAYVVASALLFSWAVRTMVAA